MEKDRLVLRTDIQAMRALAVAYVVVVHLWPGVLAGGYVGVDVFFVISGFLITSHLLTQAAEHGRVSLMQFWGNRAIRILPAAMLVLTVTALGTLLFVPQAFWQQFFREIAASTMYLENWALASDAVDYWASENPPSPVQQYWSLSVEEQFYIVMPLVLVASLRLGRRWKLWYGMALSAIVVVSFIHSVSYTAVNPSGGYFITTTRVWEFASGSLLALAASSAPRVISAAAAWIGMAMILAAGVSFSDETLFPSYRAALPVGGALLVIWARHTAGALGWVYRLKPIQFFGDLSYAIYLWHWPLIIFADFSWPTELPVGGRVALAALAVLLSWLSTRFFEEPIRYRIAATPDGRRRVLGAIAVGTIAITSLSVMMWAAMERSAEVIDPEALTDRCFGAGALVTAGCPPATVMTPDAVEFIKDNGGIGACHWPNSGHCTYGDAERGSLRVAAIGDSHVSALVPTFQALGKILGWGIDVYTMPGCYYTTADLTPMLEQSGRDAKRCTGFLEFLKTDLAANEPYDILIVTHFEGSFLPPTDAGKQQEVAGLIEAWESQIDRGTKVIALTDVPTYDKNVRTCISTHQLAAGVECSSALPDALREIDSQVEAAAELDGAVVIDTQRYFCTETECLALVGGVPVLFDGHHITGTYAATLGPLLAEDIIKATRELGMKPPIRR